MVAKKGSKQAGKKGAVTPTRECDAGPGWEVQCGSCQGWHFPHLCGIRTNRQKTEKEKWICPPCKRVYAVELQVEELLTKVDESKRDLKELQEEVGRLRAEREQQREQEKGLIKPSKSGAGESPKTAESSETRSYASVVRGHKSAKGAVKIQQPDGANTQKVGPGKGGTPVDKQKRTERKVLLLSDSIVTQEILREVQERVGKAAEVTLARYPGLTTRGLKRIAQGAQMRTARWDLVIIHCGSNDGPCPGRNKSGLHPLETASNLLNVAGNFKQNSNRVVINSILPRKDRGLHSHWGDDWWSRQTNYLLKEQLSRVRQFTLGRVTEQNLTGCYCAFQNGVPWVQERLFEKDGVHLSKSGKELLAIVFAKNILETRRYV